MINGNGSDPSTTIPNGIPSQRPMVRALEVDGEHQLFDEHGEAICVLNETALALWELCDGGTRPDEMIDAICDLCNVDHDIAELDVARTLERLTTVGVLEWQPQTQ